ncbi:hypothetical protein BDV12DRAFT_207333 [Aspergillus spectabilis]
MEQPVPRLSFYRHSQVLQQASSWEELHSAYWDEHEQNLEDTWAVARALCMHPLTVEDIAFQEPRQKIETFPGYYLISLRTLTSSPGKEHTEMEKDIPLGPTTPNPTMMYILVFSQGTVTFSRSGCGHVSRARSRISRLHDPSVLSSDWICYALLDDSDVLNGFVKRCRNKGWHPALPEGDLLVYLSDVQDHLVTILAELAHLDEITSRLQSNFLAQTSVNNMRLSVRLNSGLSKVTVLATIFVPLHMVTGLFGMNVTIPGQEVESLAWFMGIVGVFCAIILAACFAAVRLKLL